MEQRPSIGRIVHFRLTEMVVRPAIIVAVHGSSVSLQIFTGGPVDDWALRLEEQADRGPNKQTRSVIFRDCVEHSKIGRAHV